MRVGIFSSAITTGTVDDVVAEARVVGEEGFASFWVSQIFSHDALTALAVAGREVPDLELGTSVVPTFPRHPMVMAQQALTTNAACGGRLCLGIGLSHQIVIEGMFGLSFDKPVRHLREYLSVLLPLLRGEAVDADGESYRVRGALSVAGATPPAVAVAALGPQMLRLAGSMTDGTVTWCVGPNTLRDLTVPTLCDAAEAAGRPAPRVIAAFPVCVTSDAAAARERASTVFAIYGQLPSYRAMMDREGVEGPADLAIVGGAAEVQDSIRALVGVGVTDFVAAEFGSTPDERGETRAALRGLV
jgi:5,10-methylenetetrahydromethanopterin reductase